MLNREIGKWNLTSNVEQSEERFWGEDGWYYRNVEYPVVLATHAGGRIFAHNPATAAGGDALVRGLPDTFDAEIDDRFHFWRTVYGSDDWSYDDELSLMDDEERERHFLGR